VKQDIATQMRNAIVGALMPQVTTMNDAELHELGNLLGEVNAAVERELRQRKLAAAEPAGRG